MMEFLTNNDAIPTFDLIEMFGVVSLSGHGNKLCFEVELGSDNMHGLIVPHVHNS